MSKVEETILKIAELMLKTRPVERNGNMLKSCFRIDDHVFTMTEFDKADMVNLQSYRCIIVQLNYPSEIESVKTSFELVGNRISDGRIRTENFYRLAEQLVRKVLPEVDMKWKIMVNNDEVEEALAVLE